jgi:hypothetical protein
MDESSDNLVETNGHGHLTIDETEGNNECSHEENLDSENLQIQSEEPNSNELNHNDLSINQSEDLNSTDINIETKTEAVSKIFRFLFVPAYNF